MNYIPHIPNTPIENNVYVVKSGDSLWSIAKKYGITVNELKEFNNLTSNSLKIGQTLKIPGLEEEIIDDIIDENIDDTYIVQSGDTLYSIANKFGITVDELKKLNNLTNNTLTIGQVLNIKSTPEIEENYDEYIVKSGDSLYAIAKKYDISVQELKDINNLTSNNLTIGQTLLVPQQLINETDYIEYIVQKGDNLYSIANKYNITQQEIMNANNLKSNLLSIGQILKIPTSQINSQTYTVKSGDSLYAIAREFNTTVADIKTKNNLTSNNLSIGQVLII